MKDLVSPGRLFLSSRGTPYVAVANTRMERQAVESVRLAQPLRFKRERIRSYKVGLHRIRELGEMVELPAFSDREGWEKLSRKAEGEPFRPIDPEGISEETLAVKGAAGALSELVARKSTLPCNTCELFGPCQKSGQHPFSDALQRYFDLKTRMTTIREELWRSFLKHFHLLQGEGYLDENGRPTSDGLWASKLRLDQPLFISEGIRRGVFPSDDPALLAALIAPFVMDRERPGDMQQSALAWKYPDAARPFFAMLQSLQPLKEKLQAEGFAVPPLPSWTVATVYHWAGGATWEELRDASAMDEGDLAMVILRTAEHLRQIESLTETHPRLAASAKKARVLILREPVLIA